MFIKHIMHNSRKRNAIILGLGLTLAMLTLPQTGTVGKGTWEKVDDGLEVGRFVVAHHAPTGDSTVVIVRIDPHVWRLELMAISEVGGTRGLSVEEWCDRYNLTAAINAGMFDIDHRTHIGYMKSGDHVNSSRVNSYKSVAAFSPLADGDPPFRIFDLDQTTLDAVGTEYGCMIQNLRLIKRPGKNVWTPQEKRWSEAALGEDDRGRVLFIFCRSPYSMHEFNNILLSLPIGLVCAQHLEGGPEAQLYVKSGDVEIDLVGEYESGFTEGGSNDIAWPVPNIIGVVKRTAAPGR